MKRTLTAAAACVLLFGAQAAASHRNPAVSGTVQYHTEKPLPLEAILQISIVDVSLAGARSKTIATQRYARPSHSPLNFSLRYRASMISANHHYVATASIRNGKTLLYTTTSSYPMITQGASNTVALLLFAVASATSNRKALHGTTWHLKSLGLTTPVAFSDAANIVFENNHHRISGSAGCNRMIGMYQAHASLIRIGPAVGLTRMMCPPEIMKHEAAFVAALEHARHWKIHDNVLDLFDEHNTLLATFEAK